ncbi:MAG: GDSL-type esterase/lipase family protein [Eubacteriales bacterium]|nr:GDSL-type esterase/lipase family protein [Eubacteriales bacterium]
MKTHKRLKALLLGCVCAFTSAFSAAPAMADTIIQPLQGTMLASAAENSGGGSRVYTPGGSSTSSGTLDPTGGASASGGNSVTAPSAPQIPTVWIAGDSTAAEFGDFNYYSPRCGWGVQLGLYLQGVNIRNLAVSGSSSKTYPDTDQYRTLVDGMQSGDYLLIAFGHNDERAESARYSNPNNSVSVKGSFQYNLYESFVKAAQKKGVTPILCTPIVRRDPNNNYTGESGHVTATVRTADGTYSGGDYAQAIRNLGSAKNITVLDLTARTRDTYERLGPDGVKNRQGQVSQRDVSIDNTHTNVYGAACNAWFIADELVRSSCSLKQYVVPNHTEPVYSAATSINPNYQDHLFTPPTQISSLWPVIGDWKGTVFGDIDGYEQLNPAFYCLRQESDGSIRMVAGSDSPLTSRSFVGQIDADTDGLAMYYQQLPASQNFVLSADVTINYLGESNENSFGLMVRDDIYVDTVVNDVMGDYVAAGSLMTASGQPWNCFARKNGRLTSGGAASRTYRPGETVHMELRKSTDGYSCQFGENPPVSIGFDFPLTLIDSSHVYVGMFVAGSADVTFRNVSLTLQ